MSLLDHFHPPLSQRRQWQAFHNAWTTYISEDLNQSLPHWSTIANHASMVAGCLCLPINLNATYEKTCRTRRIVE